MKRIIVLMSVLLACLGIKCHAQQEKEEAAIFAGGCFWCVQHDFDQVKGVLSTTAGYTGGGLANPTYAEVATGKTGHVEAVEVKYDPSIVSYQQLLNVYWHNVDPTRDNGQFCDIGNEYRPVIFYENETQRTLAEQSKEELMAQNKMHPILVQILPAKTFYPAEEDHQEYYKKNPTRYKFYRYNCGRDQRLKELWGTS
jgi:peptide-methionine (S)-S-oxide reductase